jgi:hypothetical protein
LFVQSLAQSSSDVTGNNPVLAIRRTLAGAIEAAISRGLKVAVMVMLLDRLREP